MIPAYEVYELNNGSLYLACLIDGRPVFIGGGYEFRPGDIKADIGIFSSTSSVDGWDGNLADQDGMYEELSSDETNLICGNGELLPENMGTNGKKEFLENAHVHFWMRWDREFSGSINELAEWWDGFPYDCENDEIEYSEVKIGGFNMVSDTVGQLVHLLGI